MLLTKRAWLCVLLLVIHVRTTDSETRNFPVDALDDDAQSDSGDAAAGAKNASLVDALDDGVVAAAVSGIMRNRSLAEKPAFLRKNNNTSSNGVKEGGREIFRKAFRRAIGGGIPGAVAGVVQVLALMWVRTVTNYQYRYGSSFLRTLKTLYGMGGIPRLYSGVGFALIQAPLSRFISTAANDGVGALLQNSHWGPGREVAVAALVVGTFRMSLMPIDTCKTVMQIEGAGGLAQLLSKVRAGRIYFLYSGAFANAASSAIGHYPWFYVYNLLSGNAALTEWIAWTTGRNALIGLTSSVVSDTISNFMRVIKTTKQTLGSTRSRPPTYAESVNLILAADGWKGLFGRGLKTRILGNALQSILFTVVWRGLSERWQEKNDENIGVDDYSSTDDNEENAE